MSPFDHPEPVDGARARHPGEMRLVRAMFLDAVEAYTVGIGRANTDREFVEARQWIFAGASRGPFSFTSVCAYLGFDPQRVRQDLRKRYENDPANQ